MREHISLVTLCSYFGCWLITWCAITLLHWGNAPFTTFVCLLLLFYYFILMGVTWHSLCQACAKRSLSGCMCSWSANVWHLLIIFIQAFEIQQYSSHSVIDIRCVQIVIPPRSTAIAAFAGRAKPRWSQMAIWCLYWSRSGALWRPLAASETVSISNFC